VWMPFQEFSVLTATTQPNSKTSGGVVNAITRSGTTRFTEVFTSSFGTAD